MSKLTLRYFATHRFFAPAQKNPALKHLRQCKEMQALQLISKFVLQQVVYGNEKVVLQYLTTHPTLVEQRATVQDYSDRTIDEATPFQAAL